MKKYNSLIRKISLFEKLSQDLSEAPFTQMTEKERFGDDPENSDKRMVDVPSKYIENLMRDSHTKYNTLSPEEQKSIDWWIAGSDSIKNPSNQKTEQLAQRFNETLNKFQINNPTEKHPLIRRFRATESEIQQMLKKGEITLSDNTSTSYKSIDKFGPHTFIFKNVSTGYSLLGPNYHEAEVIIPKGTRFKILNSKKNNRDDYIIELTEIN
jgi:hypothetical protein